MNYGTCPDCGSKLLKREGKYGEFVGCTNFPNCRYTRNLISKERTKEPYSFQNNKYKAKVKLAKEFVLSNLNMTIKELLEMKKWSEDINLCMKILNDTIFIKDEEYIESVLGYAHHRKDRRSSLEYACDLIIGWIIEDCTVEILNKLGYNISLNSADRHRKILLKPIADSDLKININDKDILIEQINDFTGYWKRTLHVPLRDNKYLNLKNENSLLFGIDYINKLFFLLNVSKTKANYISYHKPFGKPAYAISITDQDFHKLDELENILLKVLTEY